ncbi:MAG TPA: ASCH domain-containing protein [Chloroflexi bacterium]|nr:ASCH domain-containing protein [Chloroflexota bacterium]
MKALSFHQPRAEQIVRGVKIVDIRTWQTTYRGSLAVHAAAQRRDARCRALGFEPDALAYGALVGTVELTDVQPLDAAGYDALRDQHLLDTPFPGDPCYAWSLASPQRFPEPIPYRGRRRLFDAAVGQVSKPAAAAAVVSKPAAAAAVVSKPAAAAAVVSKPAAAAAVVSKPAAAVVSKPTAYRVAPPPQPDPTRPFALYTLPEGGEGYRVALYQWVPVRSADLGAPVRSGDGSDDSSRPADALWRLEIGGDALRAVTDHLLAALRANGYRATDLARAVGSETPFYLDEPAGLRLALILMAVKPLTRHDRIEAIGQGIQAMGNEEAYYWFSKCSAGPDAARAQRALRVLLAGE